MSKVTASRQSAMSLSGDPVVHDSDGYAFFARLLLGWRAARVACDARRAQRAISWTDSMASSGAL